jgi:hypothetical protein
MKRGISTTKILLEIKGLEMLDKLKAQLKAAKAELKARTRQLNATYRAYDRCVNLITKLETRIEKHLAKSK